MSYHYYVVYFYGTGWGSCQISPNFKIKTIDDVTKVREYISEKWCNNKDVLILNWKPIKKSKKINGDVNDGE